MLKSIYLYIYQQSSKDHDKTPAQPTRSKLFECKEDGCKPDIKSAGEMFVSKICNFLFSVM